MKAYRTPDSLTGGEGKMDLNAVRSLLNVLARRTSDPSKVGIYEGGTEGAKAMAFDPIFKEVTRRRIAALPEDATVSDRIDAKKLISNARMAKMSDEEIYRALMDGTIDEKIKANDPMRSMFNDSPFGSR
jgi:hypothetical protein|tara:strand:+ start:53 stop:442 length:390 start_codon:yes stop_codon:yes gene_type:complete